MVTARAGRGGGVDRLEIAFDDERLVADAGLVLPAILCQRLGAVSVLEDAISSERDPLVAQQPAAKALSVVFAMLAGADAIDDCDRLRAGATGHVLPVRPRAASTLGKWLRRFGFGQVRQLDAATATLLARAWQAGARPQRLIIDLDSSITEVHGKTKRGAEYGHTRRLGYHPLFATSAATGEVLHTRLRRGAANTQYGVKRFFEETIQRCRRAGHEGAFLVRADSGFVNYALLRAILRHGGDYSIATPMRSDLRAVVEQIPADAWQPIHYPAGVAAVAECTLAVAATHRKGRSPLPAELRVVVRRVLNHDPADPQQPLFSEYRYFPILTSRTDEPLLVEAEHRQHAQIELVIRDLKDAGLAHLPSSKMYANMAWLVLATLAHNLQRWVAILGLGETRIRQHRTIRTRYLTVPGRLATHARSQRLRLPARWPWRDQFLTAINRLRALPATT